MLFDYEKIKGNDPAVTHVPATEKEVIRKYQYDPLFNRTVNGIAYALNHEEHKNHGFQGFDYEGR
jgi:hypothetical protein